MAPVENVGQMALVENDGHFQGVVLNEEQPDVQDQQNDSDNT
jgi:hypothetical protein